MIKSSVLILASLSTNYVFADCIPFTNEHRSTKYRISQIVLDIENIFNPSLEGENNRFHHISNKLHIKTKKQIILRELLFKEKEIVEHRVFAETERILRSKPFIKDAIVKPIAQCNDGIVVKVITNDNWSLQPGVSFGTSGGKSKYSFELQEKNLFGFGKSLELKYKKGIERTGKSIKYNDPNLFGSSKYLEISSQNNSDGKRQYFELINPFVSLNTTSFWEISHLNWDLTLPIYEQGNVKEELGQSIQQNNLKFGKLINNADNNYHRIFWGLTTDKSIFINTEDYPDISLPNDRDFKYPWIGYEFINEDYIKKSNFNTMGRTEDISLGHHLKLTIGNDFDDNSILYEFDYSKGYHINESNLINLKANINGIHSDGQLKNSHFILNSNWHHFQSHNRTFYLSTQINLGQNLFKDQKQNLGGESGLRGFPFRYLSGENKLLLSVEQRFFHNWYPLKTFQFASVVFVDSGSVWNSGEKKDLLTKYWDWI